MRALRKGEVVAKEELLVGSREESELSGSDSCKTLLGLIVIEGQDIF